MGAQIQMVVSPASVVIGAKVLEAQWAEFFALLALQQREDPAIFVTVDRVHRLAGWRLKQPGSVGKEIARQLGALEAGGLAGIVHFPKRSRTKAWRLGLDRSAVRLSPSTVAVAAWLEARSSETADQPAWGRELRRIVEAAILLQKGRGSEARGVLGGPPPELREPALLAWRALIEGRAVCMAEEDDQGERLDALIDAWARSSEPTGRAVETRLRSYQVMRGRFHDAASVRGSLTRLMSELERTGDAASLGVMHNVLGVLERRAGNPSRAFEHLARAVGLLGISGDYHTLQAALYNAALARHSSLKRLGQPADELAFSLLDLCLLICAEYHVGGDSALAEITRAEWLMDTERFAEAGAMLSQAARILSSAEASYDQAYFLQMRARLGFAQRAPMRDVVRDLNASIRIYGEVGDGRAEQRARAMLRKFLRARGP